jgi:hypothetical protein
MFGLLLAGCLGTSSSFDGKVYRRGPLAFAMQPPSSWRAIPAAGATLAFEEGASVIFVNARCPGAEGDVPLEALRNHLLAGTTEREFISEAREPLDGREALHSRVRAKLDGVPRFYDVYILKKDGCVYDFVHVGPEASEASANGRRRFDAFVHGFHCLEGSGAVALERSR